MIRIRDLTKRYQTGEQVVHALDGVSLDIAEGEFVAIMGASGSGKSTLMNILGCLDTPSSGSYEFESLPLERYDDEALAKIRNQKIGFVFQSFNLLPRTSALENVALPMLYAGVPPAERKRRALEALSRVGLAERIDHMPNQLSGGQQQRVSIARAIVNRPKLLLADEPTGALDSKTTTEIMDLFTELNRQGMTIVLITHERDVADFAGRIIRFRDGRVLSDETREAARGEVSA
jgi:putative ABC transport system ATP-binding protein